MTEKFSKELIQLAINKQSKKVVKQTFYFLLFFITVLVLGIITVYHPINIKWYINLLLFIVGMVYTYFIFKDLEAESQTYLMLVDMLEDNKKR